MTRAAIHDEAVESVLLLRVLSTLIREDVVGLRSRGQLQEESDGLWLRIPTADGKALLVPVEADGFQAVHGARLPLLRREGDPTGDLITLEAVLATLTELADPADRAGFVAFTEECRQTLTTMQLHETARPAIMDRLTARNGDDPARWTGLGGGVGHDALAALEDHPVYPTARGRVGLTENQLRAYAPEFHERFGLRWLLLPRGSVRLSPAVGPVLPGLPSAGDLGFGHYDKSHLAMPVHPLSVGRALDAALDEVGLADWAVLVPHQSVEVVPTLSMRTVARVDRPTEHLKLPLATSTLGLRNRRTIKPSTLADGAAGQRLVQAIIGREPRFRHRVLLADETRYAHADHELLAVLLRRYPEGLERSVVVPLAALLAQAPDGRLLIDHLADRFYGGDPLALLDAVLTLLFDFQVTLFTYGVALESHQQNISLVLDERQPPRLLLKDNDGPRVNRRRLRERGLEADGFADPRTFTDDDAPLADVFATITVHLCAGAFAFGLARHDRAPLPTLLRLVRDRLSVAVERPGAEYLRARLLDASELPVKAMVSAGTLLTKERSGAADTNKHYTTGPNYLRGLDR